MREMMPRKLVKIHWRDSFGAGLWQDIDDATALNPVECVTVGYILMDIGEKSSCKGHITVASTLGGSLCCGAICIPRISITKVEEIKEAPE